MIFTIITLLPRSFCPNKTVEALTKGGTGLDGKQLVITIVAEKSESYLTTKKLSTYGVTHI